MNSGHASGATQEKKPLETGGVSGIGRRLNRQNIAFVGPALTRDLTSR